MFYCDSASNVGVAWPRPTGADESHAALAVHHDAFGAGWHYHDRAWRPTRDLGRDASEERRARAVRAEDNEARRFVGGGGDKSVDRMTVIDEP